MNPDRPLDQVSSIKTKLALLVAVSVVVTALLALIGDRAGVPVWITVPVTLGAALAVTYWLARGMTAPLREMTVAAAAMAAGDYSRAVTVTGNDEVGVLARAFTTMAHDLAATDQQRRELISTVSHELRTPLAAQRAVLETLVDGVTPPSQETLSTALAQTERLSDLVEDLLDLSRLESGTSRLDLAEIEVAALLDSAVREAALAYPGITISTQAADGMRVRADRARLTQVLANLLDNAARHSPEGGRVTVSAVSDPQRPQLWNLDVVDEGAGIDPAVADRIFERFSTGKEHSGGTGLGLAIARWICDLHGGAIAVVPSERGARIRATLPLDPGPARPSARPSSDASTGPSATPLAGASTTSPASPSTSPLTQASSQEPTMSHPSPSTTPVSGVPTGATPPAATPATSTPGGPATPAPYPVGPVAPPSAALPGAPGGPGLAAGLWPERASDPQPFYLVGALVVGALAALLAMERRVGLIAFVVLLLGGVLVWRASAYRRTRFTTISAVLAVALGLTTMLRATEWLSVVAVMVAGVLAATALTRATKVSGIIASVAAWPLSGLRGLPLLGRTLTATSKHGMLWPVLRTAAFSLVALVLFGGLFASADAIFGTWANAVVPDLRWDSVIARVFVFVMVAGVTLAGCYLALNPPQVDAILPPATKAVRRWEWGVPVGFVIALFAGFLAAQASATLRGHEYVQETTGMSYADYVHQGFGQLTFATMLMLVVVGLTLRKAAKETAADRLTLRIMLGTLSLLTLAVVASALWRMHLYQQAYGFTTLRVFVDGFELWLGLIVLGVLVSLVPLSTRWLGRAALVSAAALMLVLVGMNPDAWVARHNIDRFASTGELDAAYLATLSDDAVPTIAESDLPQDITSCIIHVPPYMYPAAVPAPDRADDWLELNLGRDRAEAARATVPLPEDAAACEDIYDGDVRRVASSR